MNLNSATIPKVCPCHKPEVLNDEQELISSQNFEYNFKKIEKEQEKMNQEWVMYCVSSINRRI